MVTGGQGWSFADLYNSPAPFLPLTVNLMMPDEYIPILIAPGVTFWISIDELCDVTSTAHGIARSVITREVTFYNEADTDN